jgi:mannose-6-phosphate isomerase-like protein (cupin superfamily)
MKYCAEIRHQAWHGRSRKMVERIDASPDYMESERVGRFKELKSSAQAFVDARIPGYERDLYNIIGRGVVEDKELLPPILDNRDFNVGLIKAEPGKGASLHIHATNEVFFALTGKWAIYWQNRDGARHEVILEPYDTVSVPIGLSRGFRNAGEETALMLAIVGGTDPGKVEWPQETIDMAREHGIVLDENGDLVMQETATP